MKAIFAKMNVISRTEAVANATRRGLIQLWRNVSSSLIRQKILTEGNQENEDS